MPGPAAKACTASIEGNWIKAMNVVSSPLALHGRDMAARDRYLPPVLMHNLMHLGGVLRYPPDIRHPYLRR